MSRVDETGRSLNNVVEDLRTVRLRVGALEGVVGFLFFAIAVLAVLFALALDALPPAPDRRPDAHESPQVSAEDAALEMDADVLAVVAKAEDPEAAAAVMWTVVNRSRLSGRLLIEEASSGAYGSLERGVRVKSWTWDAEVRWPHPLDRAQLRRLRGLARELLEGRVADPTGGATHFHRAGTWVPPWAPKPGAWERHGSHHFYREAGA